MKEGRINLYSDTQTRPTPAMRQAMIEAEVGDEQHGLDPGVNRLCERVAALLGQETAVFLPSGTMCNEIAMLVHCRPGDEIYAHRIAHIVNYEAGGVAVFAGAQVHALEGERGIFSVDALCAALRRKNRYEPRSCLVEIEQTAQGGGGAVWSLDEILAVAEVAKARDLRLHMDGARLFNAAVAAGVPARQFAAPFDSVWIDLTKGLGCPVGAVLAGSARFIDEAWRWKQRMGGAMRQAGMLAAAGLYALDHHIDRLAEDHENARRLGEIIAQCEGVRLVFEPIETNLVFVDVSRAGVSPRDVRLRLEERSINVGGYSETLIRAATHLDVGRAQVEEAGAAFVETVRSIQRANRE